MSATTSATRREASLAPLSHADSTRELVSAIQKLSLARCLEDVQAVVRTAARRLTGADGATFVLRDGERCFYADEDAISPLWKGQRFPLEACISGWTMLNRQAVAIEDIYADERIPHDAYRPTFVKSLAMVPIRTLDPLGAIGNYWAAGHLPTAEELELLRALADSTAVAIENVRVYEELEQRVATRTAELEETNRSVRSLYEEAKRSSEALSRRNEHHLQTLNTLAHEVRTPLSAGQGMVQLILQEGSTDDTEIAADLADVDGALSEVLEIVNRQLDAAKAEAGAIEVRLQPVDVGVELATLRATFRAVARSQRLALVIEEPRHDLELETDPALLGQVLRNLVGNALKFTDDGGVRVSARREGSEVVFEVTDTGIGIAPADASKVFEEWKQVATEQSGRAAGSGLGLPLVARLVEALGGRTDLESEVGRGSTFAVTLPVALGD